MSSPHPDRTLTLTVTLEIVEQLATLRQAPAVEVTLCGGMSALVVRTTAPTRGRNGPDQFIPLAEDAGLTYDPGRFVLRQACSETAAAIAEGRPLRHLSVNASPWNCGDTTTPTTSCRPWSRPGSTPGAWSSR